MLGLSAPARVDVRAQRAPDPRPEEPAKPRPLSAYTYFFVRGHPRSGTNWVGRLLNLHPQINCQGEYHFQIFQQALHAFQAHKHLLGSRQPVKGEARRATHDLIRRCMRSMADKKPGATLLGDRTPAELRPVLPGARSILVIRDGRDVLVSFTLHNLRGLGFQMQREPFRSGLAPLRERFAADPDLFQREPELLLAHEGWVRFAAQGWAQRVRDDLARAARLRDSGSPVLEVRYEALHADPEARRREMYEFLGVDPALALAIEQGEDTAPGFARGEDPTSLRRKGVVGDFHRYLTPDATRWFMEEAGGVLEALGYVRRGDHAMSLQESLEGRE